MAMAVRKIAISMPPDLIEAARSDAEGRGESLSGWLADAAARKLRRKHARQLLAEYEAEHGVITGAEMRAARKPWPGSRSTRAR
jgi:hypothetical protein